MIGARRLSRVGRALRILVVVGLSAVLHACPHRIERPADAPTEPGPILARLAERGRAVQTLSGMVALEVWRDDERVKLRQLLLVSRPDRIRVETLSPFDQPLSVMASNGSVLSVYSLEHQRFERGPATPANLARLLRLPLSGEELTALLGGGVPIAPGATVRLSWDADAGAHVLDVQSGSRRQRLSLEPEALRLVELRTSEDGREILSARFGDYDGIGPTAIPRRMRFEVPSEKLRVDARFEDHTVNQAVPEGAFELEAPRGVPVLPL